MNWQVRMLLVVVYLIFEFFLVRGIGEIIDAINAGGPDFTDHYGIFYREDPMNGDIGTASDYGRRYLISRVFPEDQPLYQTERYHTGTFEYQIRIPEDGEYVLVLKFSEVYFTEPNRKVFDVALNGVVVVSQLDIFAQVGRAVAYDEYIPFAVKSGHLLIGNEALSFNGKLAVQFVKRDKDNPKVNALYVVRGTVQDVPKLPDIHENIEEESRVDLEREMVGELESDSLKWASGPKQADPYMYQDQAEQILPFLIALACFFPVLYCLCKL
uniref:Malectin domain-containing protein n=1 Tax=Trichuris muris TaxID=70415 RepID=A0A5S6QR25_TRIMR